MIRNKKIFFKIENSKKEEEKIERKRKKGTSTGRIKKCENKKGKHNNHSKDNIYKKLKGKVKNCIHLTLNNIIKGIYKDNKNQFKSYRSKNNFLKKIKGTFINNGKKSFNEDFLNKSIKEIYLLTISPKYKNSNNNNSEIIEKFYSITKFKEIVEMKFIEFVDKIFIMNPNEFKQKYSFDNKYLFHNLEINDSEEKKIMKEFIDFGILKYFEKINGRNTSSKDITTNYCTNDNNIDVDENNINLDETDFLFGGCHEYNEFSFPSLNNDSLEI